MVKIDLEAVKAFETANGQPQFYVNPLMKEDIDKEKLEMSDWNLDYDDYTEQLHKEAFGKSDWLPE